MASGTGLLNPNTCHWDDLVLSVLPVETHSFPQLGGFDTPLRGLKIEGISYRFAEIFEIFKQTGQPLKHIADAPLPLGQTFEPNPRHTEIYRQARQRQNELYGLISKNWW
jgi:sugar (pentulose or hexulose) kinase